MLLLKSLEYCKRCKVKVNLNEMEYAETDVNEKGYRIMRVCPHCGEEIKDIIVNVSHTDEL